MRENRLIGYTTEDFKDPTKYNSRTAAANAAAQQQTHAQALLSNGVQGDAGAIQRIQSAAANSTGAQGVYNAQQTYANQNAGFQTAATRGTTSFQVASGGGLDQSAIDRLRRSGKSEDEIRSIMSDPTRLADIQRTMSNTGLGGTARTSAVNLSPQQRADQAEQDVRNRYGQITNSGSSINPADMQRDIQQARSNALLQTQVEQKDTEMKQQKEQTTPAGQDQVTQAPPSGLQAALATLTPEEQAILGPLLQNVQGSADQGSNDNQARTKALLEGGTIDGQQVTGINSTFKTLQDQIDTMKTGRSTLKDAVSQILKESHDENEKLITQQEQAAQERSAWNQHQQEVNTAREKTKAHESMVAQYALGGGFGQDAALADVRESDASFDQKLRDIQIEFGIERTDLSAKFTGLYVQNNNDYRNGSVKNVEDYVTALERLNTQGSQNTIGFMNAQQGLLTKMWDNETALRKAQVDGTEKIGLKMLDMTNTKRDDQRAQEQLGWNILNQAIDNYGHLVPKSVVDRVQKMLPAGTDIQDIINTPTFAERNSKRISGAGGTGGGKGSFDTSMVTPQGQAFSDVTPNQLREAVDRITLNFGGTAAERNRKRSEYLDRISSGESPEGIMTSMQNDYWAAAKGAPKTAHDGRTITQGSADALQSFVDFYGIGVADDGPLGQIDSRTQGFLSVFGQSSDEYNNLSNEVNAIRAKMVKENYGTAVSPQELALAKSYIPSMTDKGAVFQTKVQNLKAYNAYLDAKVFASNVGLPQPKPPVPIKISGTAIAGAGKYSTRDITSALSQ